jgi:hypothetical protein
MLLEREGRSLARPTFTFTEGAIERALKFLELTPDKLAQRCSLAARGRRVIHVQTIRRARRGHPIVIEDAAAIAQCVHDAGYKIAGPYTLDETDLFDNFLSTLRRQRGRMKSVLLFDRVPGQDNRLAVKERTHYVKLSEDDSKFRFGGRPGEILSISSLEFSVEQGHRKGGVLVRMRWQGGPWAHDTTQLGQAGLTDGEASSCWEEARHRNVCCHQCPTLFTG